MLFLKAFLLRQSLCRLADGNLPSYDVVAQARSYFAPTETVGFTSEISSSALLLLPILGY